MSTPLRLRVRGLSVVSFFLLVVTVPAFAETAAGTINAGDTAWLLISTALVFLMTVGLAFFYGGLVREKNAIATMMQSFIALALVPIVWFIVGYSLAFGPTVAGVIGNLQWSFLRGVTSGPNPDYGATVPHSLFMIFQGMFAIITPAIISGAFAERMKFKTYLVFLSMWSLLIYSPVAHWVWGAGGFLRLQGVLDFGGGLVIHIAAGMSALAAALVFGKRVDYGKSNNSPPSNIPFVILGTGLLWFGWFGFNGGSAIASNDVAVTAFVNTHMAAAAATLTWMAIDWIVRGKPSVVGACFGALVGMIALSPACGFVTNQSAIVIGIIAGAIANLVALTRAKSELDDSLDVFACHGVGGTVGILLTGVLATKSVNPAGADGGLVLLFIQFKAAIAVGAFCFGGTYLILSALKMVMGLRPSVEDEAKGLDLTEHNERAFRLI